jgi:hypothetical protein
MGCGKKPSTRDPAAAHRRKVVNARRPTAEIRKLLRLQSLLNLAFNDVSDKTAVSLQKRQFVGKDTFEENAHTEMNPLRPPLLLELRTPRS